VYVPRSDQGEAAGGEETIRRRPNGLPGRSWVPGTGARATGCERRLGVGVGCGWWQQGGVVGKRDWRRRGWGSVVTD
jgi:hypothetical protein